MACWQAVLCTLGQWALVGLSYTLGEQTPVGLAGGCTLVFLSCSGLSHEPNLFFSSNELATLWCWELNPGPRPHQARALLFRPGFKPKEPQLLKTDRKAEGPSRDGAQPPHELSCCCTSRESLPWLAQAASSPSTIMFNSYKD